MSTRPTTRTHAEQRRSPLPARKGPSGRAAGLRLSARGDAFEREADRAADVVAGGRGMPARGLSLSRVTVGRVQREEASKGKSNEEKYLEARKKVGEVLLETELFKRLKARILEDPLVRGVKDAGERFLGTLAGKVITGTAAAGAIAALAATHTELPAQLPEIPLDSLHPGLKVKLIWEGPVDRPTKAMILFTLTERIGGQGTRPARTRAQQQREENARMAAELARFRASMRYAPGTPEARQQEMEEEAARRVAFGQVGRLPLEQWGAPPGPRLPGPSLQLPASSLGFRPKSPSLLEKELELKPASEVAPSEDLEKKKEMSGTVMRKSAGEPSADADSMAVGGGVPSVVSEVVNAPGQPLDPDTRRTMEVRFGHDFSRVRVHADCRAASSARAIRAHAYTVGENVVFDTGRYAPDTPQGRHLLAHELAHTVQQGDANRLSTGVVQRAEHGTYVSTRGDATYLDAGAAFYRSWGHPNVKRVSTMADVVTDLDRATGAIDTFRIVSHGNRTGLEIGLVPEFEGDWFEKTAAGLVTEEKFRARFIDVHLVSEDFFKKVYAAMRKDTAATALLATLGAGKDAPAPSTPLGIVLRAVVDARYLEDVRLPAGDKPKIADVAMIKAFNDRRASGYGPLVVNAAPKDRQAEVRKALAGLSGAVKAALSGAGLSFGALDPAEQATLADPFVEEVKGKKQFRRELARSIQEGAGGPYLKTLRSVKGKVNERTHVEIRGCNVGGQADTLDMLRTYFGRAGALPSISAPDLFQYFFQLNVQTYGRAASEDVKLAGAFADPATGVAEAFELLPRLKAKELTRVVDETKLSELAAKYGFDAARVRKLNPEMTDPDKLRPGDDVWLVQRSRVRAGFYKTLAEFCRGYLDNERAWPRVWAANPWLKDPSGLKPGDTFTLPPDVLKKPYATAPPTAAGLSAAIRGGAAIAGVSTALNRPIVHTDDPKRAEAIGAWLAAQRFDPQGRTAAVLARRFTGGAARFEAARRGTYVQFLSRGYPNVVDPIFPEDPRYAKHIIRRP